MFVDFDAPAATVRLHVLGSQNITHRFKPAHRLQAESESEFELKFQVLELFL